MSSNFVVEWDLRQGVGRTHVLMRRQYLSHGKPGPWKDVATIADTFWSDSILAALRGQETRHDHA